MRRFILAAALCAAATHATHAAAQTGRLISVKVHSPSLEKNLLDDSADQRVDIYLPAGYEQNSAKRYPAVYLLHGFLGRPDDFTKPIFQNMTVQGAMDTLVAAHRVPEMIVVVPNGRNKYGGSYYTNSAVTGNWEDYVIRDVVAYVDSHYRTLARPESRGIAGHSMGGFAAIVAGMKHPEVFSAVYAISPCCLGWAADFDVSNPAVGQIGLFKSVDQLFAMLRENNAMPLMVVSAAAAFSPNPAKPPFFVDLPANPAEAQSLVKRWEEFLPVHIASRYAANLKRLRGIYFDAGFADEYPHVPLMTRALSDSLVKLGVPHVYETFDGDHRNRIGARMSTRILPFFGGLLKTEP